MDDRFACNWRRRLVCNGDYKAVPPECEAWPITTGFQSRNTRLESGFGCVNNIEPLVRERVAQIVGVLDRAGATLFRYIGAMNQLAPLQQAGRNFVRFNGRKLLYFSGCDYFRMASHPAVLRAASSGLKNYGLNVAASRLTTGHRRIYEELEASLADFFGAEDALLLPSGYSAGAVAAQALAGDFSHALVDEKAHPALQDAALHLRCQMLKFKHRDAEDLRAVAQSCGRGAKLAILTDGMFARDGSVAPLAAYMNVLPPNARLIVDDAHGAGVLGKTGQGALEHEQVDRRRIIQCVTLSKAFGVYGGAVLGSRAMRKRMLAKSGAFIGCTPLPPALANAALTATKILSRSGEMRNRLHENASYVKTTLRQAGWEIPDQPGPILPIHIHSASKSEALRQQLLASDIYPPFLRYAGQRRGFFRFVISNEHTEAHLSRLVGVLARFKAG